MVFLFLFLFQNHICGGHILEKPAQSFFGAWSFLLVQIEFTANEGPKGGVNRFLKKSDHGKGHIP